MNTGEMFQHGFNQHLAGMQWLLAKMAALRSR